MKNNLEIDNNTNEIYIEELITEEDLLFLLNKNFQLIFDSVNYPIASSDCFLMYDIMDNGFLVQIMITWAIDKPAPFDTLEILCLIATSFKTRVVCESHNVIESESEYIMINSNGEIFDVEIYEPSDTDSDEHYNDGIHINENSVKIINA